MKDQTISHRQMMTVILLATFSLGTEVLVSRLAPAGAAGWLCPLLAGGAAAALAALLGRRGWRMPSGDGMGRGLAGLLLLWALFFGAAQACRIGGRLADPLGASAWVLTGLSLALAAWLAAGGLPAFARACEIFLLAVGGAFAFVMLAGICRLRWDWVLLWTGRELAQVPAGSLECLGLLSVGCWGLVLREDVVPEKGGLWRTCRTIGRLALLLAGACILVLGRFGGALTGQIHRPFFQMVSGLGLEGAFQRLEQLISALWILGDTALLGFVLLVILRLAARLLGVREGRGGVWLWGAVLFLLALPVTFWKGILAGPVLWVGNLAAGGILLSNSGAKKKK